MNVWIMCPTKACCSVIRRSASSILTTEGCRWQKCAPYMGPLAVAGWAWSVRGDTHYGRKWAWLAGHGRCTASIWVQWAVHVDCGFLVTPIIPVESRRWWRSDASLRHRSVSASSATRPVWMCWGRRRGPAPASWAARGGSCEQTPQSDVGSCLANIAAYNNNNPVNIAAYNNNPVNGPLNYIGSEEPA